MNPLVKSRPTDEHLFSHYLQRKATGAPLPPGLIEELDIYSQEPWKIFNAASDRTFYDVERATRDEIADGRGELVGYKKCFKFQGGRGSSATSGRWIMYKFSMCDESIVGIGFPCNDVSSLLATIQMRRNQKTRTCLHNDSGDRTSVICDFAVALPSSTVDGAQPTASQTVSSSVAYAKQLQMPARAAPTLCLDNDKLAFPGFSGDVIADELAPMATATMQGSNDEWMEGWMTTELDSVVHSGYNSESRSVAPEEEGSYTNLLVRASSPPATTRYWRTHVSGFWQQHNSQFTSYDRGD
ncbi:hypothetical protein EUGRSUZ_E00545 [Eucalyptus grandis]|uniref:Uncharacterized protein n=2 Tax=Eucalyptus grandis TaxID=71139 RepID=A0ACC3KRY9_EUCGR|nr:hypothetical protein EUGRSUZ_E00545 [Eucalyptus grandis]